MKIRMRVLYFPETGNAEKIARVISKEQEAKTDKIPPAYPVENEKLLIIGVDLKGSSADKVIVNLCKDMNTTRAKNVAFYAVGSGSFTAIDELKQIVSGKGVNVINDVYTCTVKGGLFKKGEVTAEDIKGAAGWADKIADSLME